MNFFTFTKLGRTLLLAGVLAVSAVFWLGCGGGDDDNPADNNNSGGTTPTYNNICGKDGTAGSCKTATMPDGKTWMTENLSKTTDGSWCYNNSADSCNKYGRLYDWETANTVCPNGWKLPDTAELRFRET